MRRDVDCAQIGHMVSSVIGFVFAHRNASAELVDFGLEHRLRSAPHAAMRNRQIAGSRSALWRFLHRHDITFKKKLAGSRATPRRRGASAPALDSSARLF